MIERFLIAAAMFALRRPGAVALAAVVAFGVSLSSLRVPLDFSFAGVMDRSQPEVARYFAASERYGLGGLLPTLLTGPEEKLDEAALEVRLALDDLDVVESVESEAPRDWLRARAPFIVASPLFERWVALADHTADEREVAALLRDLEASEQQEITPTPRGARLLLVHMSDDSFELALDADAFPRIRSAARAAVAPLGVDVRFAGMPAIIAQEQEATIERMRVLGPISLVLVLALLRVVERRPAMLATVAAPMLLGVGTTVGLIGFARSRLTLMESIFGVLIFGLAVDFAIHLLMRLREERARGADFETAIRRAIAGTGRGIVAGGVTTGGAFALLALAPDPVFHRLGLAGALGLLLCLVFLLIALPAQWGWLERRARGGRIGGSLPGVETQPAPAIARAVGRVVTISIRSPGWTLGMGAVVLGLGALGLSRFHYETNLERVFSRDIEAIDVAEQIHEQFGVDPGPWLIPARDVSEARRVAEALRAEPIFARVETVASLFPEDADERAARLAVLAPDLAARLRAESLDGPPVEADAGWQNDRRQLLDALLRAETFGPPTLDSLPEAFRARGIGPDGELLVYGFVAEPALDSAVAARERAAAQAIHPEATSINAVYEALIGTDRPWMPPLIAAVVGFVFLALWLDLRSIRLAFLALLPVVAASVVGTGLLNVLGFSFNTVTLVAVPLLFGLGVDDGIHMVHRLLEEPELPIEEVASRVGTPIVMTTLTTCASVATLLFTRHPGIESLATLLLVALPLCLLASITLLPAAALIVRAPGVALARPAPPPA